MYTSTNSVIREVVLHTTLTHIIVWYQSWKEEERKKKSKNKTKPKMIIY